MKLLASKLSEIRSLVKIRDNYLGDEKYISTDTHIKKKLINTPFLLRRGLKI